MTKRFFIAIAVYALSMILVIAVVVRLYAIAANQDIQKNPVDLRTAKFFSRPITELEMILLNLKAQAKESASFVAETAELHIIKTIGIAPEGDAGFDPTTGRIFLVLELHVTEMSDPWKETCDSTLSSFYGWFYFASKDDDRRSRLGVMQKYFGEAVRIDKDNAADAIDVFLNSIVTRVTFLVGSDPSIAHNTLPHLKWMRTCTKEDLTSETYYTEYRYQ
jgi:hypothetical protein